MATIFGAILAPVARTAVAANLAVDAAGGICAAGAQAAGFTTTATTIGQAASVVSSGTTSATAGAAVTRGTLLEVGSAGRVIPWTSGKVCGRAWTSAAAAGDVIEVEVLNHRAVFGTD